MSKGLPPRPAFLPPPPPSANPSEPQSLTNGGGKEDKWLQWVEGELIRRPPQTDEAGKVNQNCDVDDECENCDSDEEWEYETDSECCESSQDRSKSNEIEDILENVKEVEVVAEEEDESEYTYETETETEDEEFEREEAEIIIARKEEEEEISEKSDENSQARPHLERLRRREEESFSGEKMMTLVRDDSNSSTSSVERKLSDETLEGMLSRVKLLREERKKILQDMTLMKQAFNNDDQRNTTCDEIQQPPPRQLQKVKCFLCHAILGKKLNIGAVMHMGLEDGQPLCPRTIDLEEAAKEKIAEIASDSNLSVEEKYQKLLRSDLNDEEQAKVVETAQDLIDKAEDFLNEIEGKEKKHQVKCVICNAVLGKKLNLASVMHMGLEDGEPICPRALFLTKDAVDRIHSLARTQNLDFEQKYEMLKLMPIDTVDNENDTRESLNIAENFLEDIEERRLKDKEEQEAIRNGEMSAMFDVNEEIVDPVMVVQRDDTINEEAGDADRKTLVKDDEEIRRKREIMKNEEKIRNLLKEINETERFNLKSPDIIKDRSDPMDAGKVLRFDLAPPMALKSYRSLMRQISDENNSRNLRKTKTNDRSAPFIPEDIEVFCVGNGDLLKKKFPEKVAW